MRRSQRLQGASTPVSGGPGAPILMTSTTSGRVFIGMVRGKKSFGLIGTYYLFVVVC